MNHVISACGHSASVECLGADCPVCTGHCAWSVEADLVAGGVRSLQVGSALEARRVYARWVKGGKCLRVSALAWYPDASFDTLYQWDKYEIPEYVDAI